MTEEILFQPGTTLVRRLCLAPGEALPWHRDPFHRVTVVLQGDALAVEYQEGGERQSVPVTPGQVDWDEPTERLPLVRREAEQDFGMFRLPSDQLFEVFGPKSVEHSFMTMPVMAFDVENIHAARAELEAQGVEFVTQVETSPSGENAWTYFVGPDGFLYEIWQRGKKTDTT